MAVQDTIVQSLKDFKSRILNASYEDTLLAYLATVMAASLKDMLTHWRIPERVIFDLWMVLLLGAGYTCLTFTQILRYRVKRLVEHHIAINDLEREIMKQGKRLKETRSD